jgi:hypothetical protein
MASAPAFSEKAPTGIGIDLANVFNVFQPFLVQIRLHPGDLLLKAPGRVDIQLAFGDFRF